MVNAAVTRKNLATVTRTATKQRVVRVHAQAAESSSRRQVRVCYVCDNLAKRNERDKESASPVRQEGRRSTDPKHRSLDGP